MDKRKIIDINGMCRGRVGNGEVWGEGDTLRIIPRSRLGFFIVVENNTILECTCIFELVKIMTMTNCHRHYINLRPLGLLLHARNNKGKMSQTNSGLLQVFILFKTKYRK